jgi:hypothetical protein
MSWLYENIVDVTLVLGLAGLTLVFLGYVGHVRFPYFGGIRMPWDDIDFTLTENTRRVCKIIGLLLLAITLPMCVLAGIAGGI